MKAPITHTLAMLASLISGSAMAQSVTSQITMTRGYAQSILTKLSASEGNRFQESADYAVTGPQTKASMEKALTEFRNAMDAMMNGAFTDSVNAYNETFNDTKLPDAEKKQALELQRKIIDQQLVGISLSYQNEIKRLYRVPNLGELKYINKGGRIYIQFEDQLEYDGDFRGMRSGYAQDVADRDTAGFYNGENKNELSLMDSPKTHVFENRFKSYLLSICQSRVCAGGILQQLSSYLLYVKAYLDRNINVTLADGSQIAIEALDKKPGSEPSGYLMKTITQFKFDSEFSNLPLKN